MSEHDFDAQVLLYHATAQPKSGSPLVMYEYLGEARK